MKKTSTLEREVEVSILKQSMRLLDAWKLNWTRKTCSHNKEPLG